MLKIMWKTVIILGCSIGAVFAIPIGPKNMPIMADEPAISKQKTEIAMSTLNLPSNATSIRADITDGFTCSNKTYGYYADVENDCQIFHVCLPVVYPDGRENTFRWSFICPEETLFSQESFTCVRGEDMNYDCTESERFYELNRNFGMGPDSSMEMSSMEADMDEYYMKSELSSPIDSKPSEALEDDNVAEVIVTSLLKDVDTKKENHLSSSTVADKRKPPLRSSTRPKFETSRRPATTKISITTTTTTSTTKRPTKLYGNMQRRPIRPQSTTMIPITIQRHEETTAYEISSTSKPLDKKDESVALPTEDDVTKTETMMVAVNPMSIDEVENINGNKLNDNIRPQEDANVKREDLMNNAPLLIGESKPENPLSIVETMHEKEESMSSISVLNKLIPEHVEELDNKTPIDEIRNEEGSGADVAITEGSHSSDDELILKASSPENTKIEISDPIMVSEENSLPQEESMGQIMVVETTILPTPPSTSAYMENQNQKHELDLSSQQQEEMIIKTITDLVNSVNLAEPTEIPVSEPSKTEDLVENDEASAIASALETSASDQLMEKEEDAVEKTESTVNLAPSEGDVLSIQDYSNKNKEEEKEKEEKEEEEMSEIIKQSLLENVKNKESSQYIVDTSAISNSLQPIDNKNLLENIDNVESHEQFLIEDADFDKKPEILIEEIIVPEVDISADEKLSNEDIGDSEIIEKIPNIEDLFNEEPTDEKLPELVDETMPQESLETLFSIPIHELIIGPSQAAETITDIKSPESDEQIIPVVIVKDGEQDEFLISNENSLNNDELDSSPEPELLENPFDDYDKIEAQHEIQPIYHRLQELHSNLLKANLLSADTDDEPTVHEIISTELDKKDSHESNLAELKNDSTPTTQQSDDADVSAMNITKNFLEQTNASKNSLTNIPPEEVVVVVVETTPEILSSSLEEITEENKTSSTPATITTEAKITETFSSASPDRSEISRRLKKKMDPRKRRFLFKADAS